MVELTYSLQHWLWENHREDLPLIMFGHIELFLSYQDDYIEWCKTDEGKKYLEGGSEYEKRNELNEDV